MKIWITALAALGLVATLPAQAQFQKPEDAIKYRKSVFVVQGTHFGRIAAMAQGKVAFDAKAALANAEVVNVVAALPWAAFGEGTDKGETRAKAEIWAEPEKFKAAAQRLQDEATKLLVAAKSGNLDQIKVAAGDTGKACKACHDAYRKD
jgi:cytochrome c556